MFTAMTWQAVAAPITDAALPTLAGVSASMHDSSGDSGVFRHPGALWVAALQLAMFSLGWRSPALGFERWRQEGFPTDDERLEVIAHLLGPDIDTAVLDLLAFLFKGDGRSFSTSRLSALSQADWSAVEVPPPVLQYIESGPHVDGPWGGGTDRFHLLDHTATPACKSYWRTWCPGEPQQVLMVDQPHEHALLMANCNIGWYDTLHDLAAGPQWDIQRWETIDVVVKPVGWMGSFRWSEATRRWFAGPHSLHEWGG